MRFAIAVGVLALVVPDLVAQTGNGSNPGTRVRCPITTSGSICDGGFWPAGSPDQYVFQSGLQVAGIISSNVSFGWVGDTVALWPFDLRGVGSDLVSSPIFPYPDLRESELPDVAVIHEGLFPSELVGRRVVGDRQTWQRLVENIDLSNLLGRGQPSGLFGTQRAFSFGEPGGNEDIVYVVNTFYNATSTDPSTYQNLPAALSEHLLGYARRLHRYAEGERVDIPSQGYALTRVHIGLASDPDVGNAGTNSATVVLPFNMALGYKTNLEEPTWIYDPTIFRAPFGRAPGLIGNKFIAMYKNGEPIGTPMTMFTNYGGGGTTLPPPRNEPELFEHLIGYPTARGCSFPGVRDHILCFLIQNPVDARFLLAGGGVSLNPGESLTLVHAYIFAPTMDFIVQQYQGGVLYQHIPKTSAELIDPSNVRAIEQAAGWAGATDLNGDDLITEDEVETVPGSLLWKAQLAQRFVENGFLRAEPPGSPGFQLVPGNGRVTVVWQKSPSETRGDSYYGLASNPGAAGHDPNYRQFDVEGYRIYRGTSPNDLQLIATFDYGGTSFDDFTGSWDYGDECAPELGATFAAPPNCPVDFTSGESVSHPLAGTLIQVSPSGRALSASDRVIVTEGSADTLRLRDTGVPFAYIDTEVETGKRYYYAVTAFDYNSISSGPVTQESPIRTQQVLVRRSPNQRDAPPIVVTLNGDDELDVTRPRMSIDPGTGIFTSPTPTDNPAWSTVNLVPELIGESQGSLTVDSVLVAPGAACVEANDSHVCYRTYVTADVDGTRTSTMVEYPWPADPLSAERPSLRLALDTLSLPLASVALYQWSIPAGAVISGGVTATATASAYIDFSSAEGLSSGRSGGLSPGGSRWFAGTENEVDHPASSIRVGSLKSAGVDTVWAPIAFTDILPSEGNVTIYSESQAMQCFAKVFAGLGREADVQLVWRSASEIEAVRDITHKVDVPFSPQVAASYGFINDFNGDGVISWRDFDYIENAAAILQGRSECVGTEVAGATGRLAEQPVFMATSTDGDTRQNPPQTGTGFGLYVNGERYLFEGIGSPPTAGDVWTLRTYSGVVSAQDGTAESSTPSGYRFAGTTPSPSIPGVSVRYESAGADALGASNDSTLALVHTVPDPYYVEPASLGRRQLAFVNLPPQAIIRIYSISGILVDIIEHNPGGLGGEATWDVKTRNGDEVATGVYFYHVETPEGLEHVGRFTVVNASGAR